MQREPGPLHLLFMLVAFAALFMYGRSVFTSEGIFITSNEYEVLFSSRAGLLGIGICPNPRDAQRYAGTVYESGQLKYARINREQPRTVLPELHYYDDYKEYSVELPYMIIFFLALAIPFCRHLVLAVRHRFRIGPFCPRCDYSLAGSPTGVCPECGDKSAARSRTPTVHAD